MQQTMTPQAVEQALVDAMVMMGPDRSLITRDARFEDLELDSLDLVELLQVAEERFGVEINPEDANGVETVGDALDLVLARVS